MDYLALFDTIPEPYKSLVLMALAALGVKIAERGKVLAGAKLEANRQAAEQRRIEAEERVAQAAVTYAVPVNGFTLQEVIEFRERFNKIDRDSAEIKSLLRTGGQSPASMVPVTAGQPHEGPEPPFNVPPVGAPAATTILPDSED